MTLPDGCLYEFQMQYGSIGWAVGALLGYALALDQQKRVIALIGDGSFQLTAQEVSTMIRYKLNPIIFLINNHGYTIEVEIHDGPYNNIKNWDYADLVQVFNAGEGNGWSCRVQTVGELAKAIRQAQAHEGLALIECIIDRDDCTKELLEWGSRVAAANNRPHQI
jgi:TPP-dependent 2-oxoacid decarboxylase